MISGNHWESLVSVLNFDQAELDPEQSEEAGGDDTTIFWSGHKLLVFKL